MTMTGQSIAVVELETAYCRAVLELGLVALDWAEMGSREHMGKVDKDNQPFSALRAPTPLLVLYCLCYS